MSESDHGAGFDAGSDDFVDVEHVDMSDLGATDPIPSSSGVCPTRRRRRPTDDPDEVLSPKKKRLKRTPLNSTEKETVRNIYKQVVESWPKDTPLYKSDVVIKTAEIAGISRATVYNILKEYKNEGRVASPSPRKPKRKKHDDLDSMTLGAIRRKVHTFFFENELPTLDKILEAVNSDDSLPNFSRSTLYRLLKDVLKFRYVKRSRKSALLEKQEIVLWRVRYLQDIERFRREERKIYYLDETWLNEGHTKGSIWEDTTIKSSKEAHREGLSTGLKNPSGKGRRLIIGHIGSADGFLENSELIFDAKKSDGDYHSEMDSFNFEKWFTGFIPKIESGSVIVMDNASYHSRRLEKVPSSSTRKAEIQAWLQSKNIGYQETEIRAQLLEKVKMHKSSYQTYVVDELAKKTGITVLRLPPYHCELNPIELIWAQIKDYVAKKNKTFKLNEIKVLLPQAIKSITPEKWQACIAHVIKEEQKFRKLDHIVDEMIEKFIISVGDSSSSSSSSDEGI